MIRRNTESFAPFENQHTYVHPCTINKKRCMVYPVGLDKAAPTFFNQLKRYFSAKGYQLKEEQRCSKKIAGRKQERRRWMSILLVTAAMLTESPAFSAATNFEKISPVKHQVELNLIPEYVNTQQPFVNYSSLVSFKTQSIKSHTALLLYRILDEHYVKNSDDPTYIAKDLRAMANYFSQYPKVISLINSLKTKQWHLEFDESTWSTIATGTAINVERATIHFNTRSAAKLKLHNSCNDNPVCIASPADALLHELLHTHSMLVKTGDFIEQGGMNRFRYPFKHEYAVIKLEQKLYNSMSKLDGIKRPYRNEHTGRKIVASCVTCIK